jgi:hypothetical protein
MGSDPGRLERVLDPSYVDALSGVASPELRRRKSEAWDVEDELSYQRRILHGQLDILTAELEGRRDADGSAQETIERLKGVLARGPGGGSRGARVRLSSRTADRADAARDMVSKAFLGRLPDMGVEEIEATVARLVAEERSLNEQRSGVHHVIDALEAELIDRYKAGVASADDLLGGG